MANTLKTVCDLDMCTGCMACVQKCAKNAISITDDTLSLNATIDQEKCINCNQCYNVCQVNYPLDSVEPTAWYQGWANDQEVRKLGSSGGTATAISKAFIKNGGAVVSCAFKNGEFIFDAAESESDLVNFSGSKYVKSNPKDAYKKVSELLKEKKVLFIGLPCQVAALIKHTKNTDNLYTIDLICHGTPSKKLLEKYLLQHGTSLCDEKDIRFRQKTQYGLSTRKGNFFNGTCDSFSLSFLSALNFTENCYHCNYAKIQRVSDVTLGDSWGSTLSREQQAQGVSLILCQTEKGKELVKLSNLHLQDVDLNLAKQYNGPLNAPNVKSNKRDYLLQEFKDGKNYDRLVLKLLPKQTIRQYVKRLLIKLRII